MKGKQKCMVSKLTVCQGGDRWRHKFVDLCCKKEFVILGNLKCTIGYTKATREWECSLGTGLQGLVGER